MVNKTEQTGTFRLHNGAFALQSGIMGRPFLSVAKAVLAVIAGLILVQCAPDRQGLDDTSLADVQARGELVVLTLEGPTSFEPGGETPAGYEVELAQAFADSLGVAARFEPRRDIDSLFDSLDAGEGHIAAANLTVTPARRTRVSFGPAYKSVTEQLICRRGGREIPSLFA